jgi:hypothetical protein
MTTLQTAIVVCALSTLAACAAEKNAQVSLRSLHQSPYCGGEAAGMRWLSRADLANLLGNGVGSRGGGQHLGADPAPAPTLTDDEKLLLLSLGQKNSGGYGIALASSQTPIQDKAIQLPLDLQQPTPGSMQTMQLTYPCVVLALRGGGYRQVNAEALGSLTVED